MTTAIPQANDVPRRRQGRPTKEHAWAQQIADLNRRIADNTILGETFAYDELNDEHPVVIERARLITEEGELTVAILRRLLQDQRADVRAFVSRFLQSYTGWDI